MEANYRVKMYIYDSETEETVCVEDEPLMADAGEVCNQAFRLRRRFEVEKSAFKDTYYPTNKKHEI